MRMAGWVSYVARGGIHRMGGTYFLHPFDVDWRTNFAPFSHMRRVLPPSQFYMFFTFHIMHTAHESSHQHVISLRSTLHTLLHLHRCFIAGTIYHAPFFFHLRYYLSSIMSSTGQSTSSTPTGFDKNLSEVLSQNPPVRVGYTCTQRSHSTLAPCAFVSLLPWHRSILKSTRRIHFAAKRRVCLVHGWDATKIHVNKKRSGFWWDAGKEGRRVWTCKRVESYWTG